LGACWGEKKPRSPVGRGYHLGDGTGGVGNAPAYIQNNSGLFQGLGGLSPAG
jgi:hypothetical protein